MERYDLSGNRIESIQERGRDEFLDLVFDCLSQRYETESVNGETLFHSANDTYFRPFLLPTWGGGAVGVEYAHGIEEAEKDFFEDGTLFFLEDHPERSAILQGILEEIESLTEAPRRGKLVGKEHEP